ncbi:MAG TPA: hypothetical protein VIM30_12925 [Candidatus Limnocylindrales bacterium]
MYPRYGSGDTRNAVQVIAGASEVPSMLTYELARAIHADREREIEANRRARKIAADLRRSVEPDVSVDADATSALRRPQPTLDGQRLTSGGQALVSTDSR